LIYDSAKKKELKQLLADQILLQQRKSTQLEAAMAGAAGSSWNRAGV
jgi:hypothetical protein